MKALALHRRGIQSLRTGAAAEATTLFSDALSALNEFLIDPTAPEQLLSRAVLIPGYADHGSTLAHEFLEKIGGWITEWHFELYYSALLDRQLSVARLHWQLLQLADRLPALSEATQISLRRDMVCQRLQVNSQAVEVSGSGAPPACRNADLILSVDPLNGTARGLAVSSYSRYAQHIVGGKRRLGRRTLPPPGMSRAGVRRRLRLATRMINRHLTAGRAALDAEAIGQGYGSLAHFHLVLGEPDKALKMVRRARRVKPGDRELAQLMRNIRGMAATK